MPDLDAIKQIGRPTSWHQLENGILRNATSPVLPRPTNKDALHGIARCLVGRARDPADRRLVETPTHPPIGIAPGRMHGAFHAARKRFAALVGRYEQIFSVDF